MSDFSTEELRSIAAFCQEKAAEEIMRVFHLEHEEIEESGMTMEEFLKKTEEEREII